MKLAKHLSQGKIIYWYHQQEDIKVVETNDFRWLILDDIVQSMVNKRAPNTLTLPHQIALMLPFLFSSAGRILMLGLGGGDLHRFINRITPSTAVTTVELNLEVINCYQRYFNSAKINGVITHQSAQEWLRQHTTLNFDWLIVDIFATDINIDKFERLLLELMNKAQPKTIVSINMAGGEEQHLNHVLTRLKSLQVAIAYFAIPHYKNVVIHLSKNDQFPSLLGEQQCLLPLHLRRRWARYWRHGIFLPITTN